MMTKSEFLNQLRSRISNLPPDEVERTISYFTEIIDDRIEDGMSEQEAVAGMESIDTIIASSYRCSRNRRIHGKTVIRLPGFA
jgi:uncharacterized membrane protein